MTSILTADQAAVGKSRARRPRCRRDVPSARERGLSVGLAIAAIALLPLSHALTGNLRPYTPAAPLAAILGTSALLALLALELPTRRALRARPVQAIGTPN